MPSHWQWRLHMIAPLIAATPTNKNALADIVASHSGESQANERKMFDNAMKLALSATPLVQVAWGLSFPVKLAMRDELQALISSINSGQLAANRIHWYLLNSDSGEHSLQASSRNSAYVTSRMGQVFMMTNALADLGLVQMSELL